MGDSMYLDSTTETTIVVDADFPRSPDIRQLDVLMREISEALGQKYLATRAYGYWTVDGNLDRSLFRAIAMATGKQVVRRNR